MTRTSSPWCSWTLAVVVIASLAPAQLRVGVMPGYPNAPKVTPEERRPVRPGVPTFVWGNANGGNGTANGASYTWSFSPNQNLSIVRVAGGSPNGPFTGTVTNDRFIAEEIVFNLLNQSTRETVTATLTVDAGAGGIAARSVQLAVIATNDPAASQPLQRLAIDANIAIEDGLRYLYRNQNADGSWTGNSVAGNIPCAATGFVVWAFENQRHLPTNDVNEDIYAEWVQKGLDFLFRSLQVLSGPNDTLAPRANLGRGATQNGRSDLNSNGKVITLCPGTTSGYASSIACAAIIASAAPNRVVGVSPSGTPGAIGMTYKQVVEDVIDWFGHTQNEGGNGVWNGRGGWNYDPTSTQTRSDMSINSWMFVALEGADDVFNIDIPDWIAQEAEYALVNHQSNVTGVSPFGYTNAGSCLGPFQQMMATSGGGLSGLVVVEREGPHVTPAQIINAQSGPLNSITAKRNSALAYIGQYWHEVSNGPYCNGHFNNYYGMWTLARALRLTAKAMGLPQGQNLSIVNNGVSFDWETGEDLLTGTVAGLGNGAGVTPVVREGYANWLVRNRSTSGDSTVRGRWNSGINFLGPIMESACAVLVLTPRVFPSPCPAVVNIPIVELSPPVNTGVPPGTQAVLSGRAVSATPERPILAVLVNDVPADSLDASGRFFKTVTINGGINTFTVRAVDACGASEVLHTIVGGTSVNQFQNLSNVTTDIAIQYTNTTFNTLTNELVFTGMACNSGTQILDGPVVLVIDNITQPSIQIVNPDGTTPSGKPYFVFLDNPAQPHLGPGQCSPPKTMRFHNPSQLPLVFSRTWLAVTNRPPVFVSSPVVTAGASQAYVYQPQVVDPDGDTLTFSLDQAPAGMTIQPALGLVTWTTPPVASAATFSVVVRASDGRGGSATQSYFLDVLSQLPNHPPVFTSVPPSQSAIGASYHYQVTAFDPDADPITFSKIAGPSSLTVSASGAVDWPFVVPGTVTLTVRASDPSGAYSEQTWALSAGSLTSSAGAPLIFGTPPTIGVAGSPYLYQAVGSTPAPGQTHTWSLGPAPTGMQVDPASGLVTWTPGSAQVGVHNVLLTLSNGAGGSAAQAWSVQVYLQAPNRPPVITSTPPLIAEVNVPYSYAVVAQDPDQDAIVFGLVNPPAGMTINSATGALAWTPSSAGGQTVAISATDPHGAFGSQVYFLNVLPPNHAPVIVSTAATTATIGSTYYYDVNATDADADPITYSLVTAPTGMSIGAATGVIAWNPTLAQVGPNPVVVRASDGRGGQPTQSFTVTVTPDNQAPLVSILVQPSTVPAPIINAPITICVQAGDNVGVVSRTLSIAGVPATLDGFWCTTITPAQPGPIVLAATAADAAGNVGTTSTTINVVDPNPANAPTVSLVSPAPGTVITGPTPIVANVVSAQPLGLTWQVRLTNARTGVVKVVAQGNGTVNQGTLGVIDPTLLPNDGYTAEITATNGAFTFTLPFEMGVAGTFKLGNFRYETVDVAIPVAGIPLAVTRRYDSLDTSPGDFGAGWSLGLNVRVSDVPKESPREGFHVGTRVYVTRSDGRRVGFSCTATPTSWLFPFIVQIGFTPDAGVTDTLELAQPEFVIVSQGVLLSGFADVFNPDEYKFTTQQGVVYTLSEATGLENVVDANGNSLAVTPQGIFSSTGVALLYQRDSAGRITSITEPQVPGSSGPPSQLTYVYDAIGNLTEFHDELGRTVKYFYQQPGAPHYMTRAEDPTGNPFVRNVYDGNGRLIAQCSGDGDPAQVPANPCGATPTPGCTLYCFDPMSTTQTIYTARGHRVDLVIDLRGNVLLERHYLANGTPVDTTFTYWPGTDLVHTTTDAEGNVTTQTYDAAGRIVSETGETGTYTFTYNGCGELATETDPLGNTYQYVYDSACQLRTIIDPLGGHTQVDYQSTCGVGGCHVSGYTDPVGNHWSVTYDAFGNPQTTTDPRGFQIHSQYDAVGQLVRETDRTGRQADYAYDASGRITTVTYNTTPPEIVRYTYDSGGRLVRVVDNRTSVFVDYWPTGLVRTVKTSGPGGWESAIAYARISNGQVVPGYDANGNVTHITDSTGAVTEYVYDELDRIVGARHYGLPGAQVAPKSLDVTLDRVGNLIDVVRSSAGAADVPLLATHFDYACVGCGSKLTGIHHRLADASVVEDLTFTRDVLGRPVTRTDRDGSHAYAYDGLGRLLGATHTGSTLPLETYSYDATGNRASSHLSPQYTYGYQAASGGNQLLQDGTYAYTYDPNGSLIERLDQATQARINYTYDHRSRLVGITHRNSVGTVVSQSQFTYDPFDRIIQVQDAAGTRRIIWSEGNPLAVVDAQGTVLRRSFYGPETDDLLAEEVAGQTQWVTHDDVGTVRTRVVDPGTITTQYAYDSFGRLISQTPANASSTALFGGRDAVDGSGLLAFRARFYDPLTGRFTQEDPVSPYQYEWPENDPLFMTDPSGKNAIIEYQVLLGRGLNYVYVGCDIAQTLVYVGITLNFAARAGQHAAAGRSFKICKVIDKGVSRKEARLLEQCLIDKFGGPKGPHLQNKINSIGRSSPLRNLLKKVCGPFAPLLDCAKLVCK